jgi:hypothetical protein
MEEVNSRGELLDERDQQSVEKHWCMGPLFKTTHERRERKSDAKRKRDSAEPE